MEESEKGEHPSLTERYKLIGEDEASKNWTSLLDFESPVQVESDWYSTKTFQMFLDALDINPPTTLGRDGSNSNLNDARATVSAAKPGMAPWRSANDKNSASSSKTEFKGVQSQSNSNLETILSAEALKILSELPDLSHMSASRSFIFPNDSKNSAATINGRR